ncbi:ABC transporter ATP-binding protein [Thalassotalea fonticola]|uniref:ABC transporter ATP-binding protein n=1 Tax=Thalassotalea fonticola TaxID=3065649 RepID=A0ABZ0GQC2_9GAMM|nr:ABC transporter ATP-binding protein [Colwelliaceae bacterium S1-1]
MLVTISDLTHWVSDGTNKRRVLSNLSMQLEQNECIALMGDSGCGKTTLLNLIAGLEPIQQGEIKVAELELHQANERELSKLRKQQLGIIFQQFNLLSSLKVSDNVEFSARLANRLEPSLSKRLIRELGIYHLLDKYPNTLSGGEMQRVAIARALTAQPQLLLADEPTGDLDERNSDLVIAQLIKLVKSQHTALLMVTHSEHVARKMDKVYRLSDGKLELLVHLSAG